MLIVVFCAFVKLIGFLVDNNATKYIIIFQYNFDSVLIIKCSIELKLTSERTMFSLCIMLSYYSVIFLDYYDHELRENY